MRYAATHKRQTREKLVRASAAVAKREGFAGTGIDALSKAAELTSGAFYKHFAGKAELLSAIVESELGATKKAFGAIEPGSPEMWFAAIDAYLSLGHVRRPESGCALPALAAEIARAPVQTKEVFERALEELTDIISAHVRDEAAASSLISLCAGAVMIARALATDEAKRKVLGAARNEARRLVGRAS